MQLAARTGAWAKSGGNAYYAEYLESDGTTRMDTGLSTDPSDVHECKFEGFQFGVQNRIFGYYDWSGANFSININWDGGRRNGHSYVVANLVNVGQKSYGQVASFIETIKADPAVGVSFSGVLSSGPYSVSKRDNNKYGIFGYNWGNYGSRMRIYYHKTWRKGELIRYWRPYFDGDNACFKDDVMGEQIYGLNPAAITAGPKIEEVDGVIRPQWGGYKCLTPRRSYRRSSRPSAQFCALASRHSQEWEVAA